MDIKHIRLQNLGRLRDTRFGGVQAALAAAIGRSESQVSQWVGGIRTISEESARMIEDKLGLAHGALDAEPDDWGSALALAPVSTHRVRVLSWAQAGAWGESGGDLLMSDDVESVMTLAGGERAFALVVRGESMAPDFRPGDYIVVDPDVEARHGSLVVVRLRDSNEATFKRLLLEPGSPPMLEAINPSWPQRIAPHASGFDVCGVVVEMTRRYT